MTAYSQRLLAALLVVAATAACAGESTTAPVARPDLSGRDGRLSAWQRTPSATLYRDAGKHAVTVRSGSVSLSALALVGRDGIATLELSAAEDSRGADASLIAGIQLEQGTAGRPRIAGATQSLALAGLMPGGRVRALAGIRTSRYAPVTAVRLAAPVVRRPDLAVTDLSAPQFATVGIPVMIGATIVERNGDLGAHADCVLYVDGARADVARGIWVDAGDAVSCAFSYRFSGAAGPATIAVRAENVRPGEYDPRDNEASAVIDVGQVHPMAFTYQASAFDKRSATLDSSYTTVTGPQGLTYEGWEGHRVIDRSQGADFAGAMGAAVSFPLARLRLVQRTGFRTLSDVTLSDVASTYEANGASCAGGDLDGGVSFSVCASPAGTEVRYLRRAGRVTYQSTWYALDWYQDASGTPYYVLNNDVQTSRETTSGGTYTDLSGPYSFEVRLHDRGSVYGRAVVLPFVAPTVTSATTPRACSSASIPTDEGVYVVETCSQSFSRSSTWSASASGVAGTP